MPAQPDGRPPLANFLFDGGGITEEYAAEQIRLQAGELRDWRLTAPGDWDRLLVPHMARRVRAALEALHTGTTAYLHRGRPPGAGLAR